MKLIENIVILAAGDSDRFWPFTDKYLFSFLGQTLLSHLTTRVKPFCKNLLVVTATSHVENIKQTLDENITVIPQGKIGSGMAAAVMSCQGVIRGEAVILNAADFFNFEIFNEYIKIIEEKKPDYLFLAKKIDTYFPGAYAVFSENIITGFVEKPDPEHCPSNVTKLVADYFKDIDSFIHILKTGNTGRDDDYETGINRLLDQNIKTAHVLYEGNWYMIKYPWQILSMMNFFLQEQSECTIDTSCSISKKAILKGPIHLGKRVIIGDYCKIVGPVFIGDDTVIGDRSLIRESHIGNNCLIGSSTEVARSYIHNNVSLHRNYVGDSILGDSVLMGAGAVTANFRFDQKEISTVIKNKKISTGRVKLGACIGEKSKIGVNVTLLPGIKVGKASLIAPGEVIKKDVTDNTFFSEQKDVLKK